MNDQPPLISRRSALGYAANGLGAMALTSMLQDNLFAATQASIDANSGLHTAKAKRVIFLWMSGGPAQQDTFDMKPDHENGGEFKEVQTAVPGLRFSEHLLPSHAGRTSSNSFLATSFLTPRDTEQDQQLAEIRAELAEIKRLLQPEIKEAE